MRSAPQTKTMMVCCSGSKGNCLVLDIWVIYICRAIKTWRWRWRWCCGESRGVSGPASNWSVSALHR